MFKIYGMPSTCALYIEIAFSLKKLKSNYSVYFMPNDDHNSSYLLKKTEAEDFCYKMFKKIGISEKIVVESMGKFDRVVKTDLAVRVVHNKVTAQDENEKNRYISFDSLIEFILDVHVDANREDLVRLVASLKISGANRYDSRKCFEDFSNAVDRH
jgi:hypothetical protein